MTRLPNADQLRDEIDHGRTGDKVDFIDPAAAPLGTDAEAAGHPPKPEEIAIDLSSSLGAEGPRRRDLGVPIYLGLISFVGLVILAIVATA
jgi:hypothetical protein